MKEHPAVDVATDRAAVLLQQRPVIGLSRWINDVVHVCVRDSKLVQIVTPETSRLTTPLETVMLAVGGRWVVRTPDNRYYDGLRGDALRWDGQCFRGTDDPIPAEFVDTSTKAGGLLRVDVSVLHRASETTEVGGLAEDCFVGLTGKAPAGWGVGEPASQRWDTGEFTRFCRERAPRSTTLVVVGQPESPSVALVEIGRTQAGVRERVRIAVGSTGQPDLAALDRLASHLTDLYLVRSMIAGLEPGRADCTVDPRFTGFPVPYGLLIGPEGVADVGADRAADSPAAVVQLVGPDSRQACWNRLVAAGEERDPQIVLEAVLRHFGLDGRIAGSSRITSPEQ
ncbi:DUF6177 family protein [Fodinicola feengrottensis]|uniref:DUF6177 family protein n=1 Tax=Fodinicola feengrottensis TaxID=435914 RepID=UPI0031E0097A